MHNKFLLYLEHFFIFSPLSLWLLSYFSYECNFESSSQSFSRMCNNILHLLDWPYLDFCSQQWKWKKNSILWTKFKFSRHAMLLLFHHTLFQPSKYIYKYMHTTMHNKLKKINVFHLEHIRNEFSKLYKPCCEPSCQSWLCHIASHHLGS